MCGWNNSAKSSKIKEEGEVPCGLSLLLYLVGDGRFGAAKSDCYMVATVDKIVILWGGKG